MFSEASGDYFQTTQYFGLCLCKMSDIEKGKTPIHSFREFGPLDSSKWTGSLVFMRFSAVCNEYDRPVGSLFEALAMFYGC